MIDATNSMGVVFDAAIMSVSNTTAMNGVTMDDSAQSIVITQG